MPVSINRAHCTQTEAPSSSKNPPPKIPTHPTIVFMHHRDPPPKMPCSHRPLFLPKRQQELFWSHGFWHAFWLCFFVNQTIHHLLRRPTNLLEISVGRDLTVYLQFEEPLLNQASPAQFSSPLVPTASEDHEQANYIEFWVQFGWILGNLGLAKPIKIWRQIPVTSNLIL